MSESQKNLVGQINVKKRGRKSKKEIEESKKIMDDKSENIVVKIHENCDFFSDSSHNNELVQLDNNNNNNIVLENMETKNNDKPVSKKRGRKPKGGKIVQNIVTLNDKKEVRPNVILHLKCSLKDLGFNNKEGSNIEGFSFSNPTLTFDVVNDENNNLYDCVNEPTKIPDCNYNMELSDGDLESNKNKEYDIRDIWKKLKVLEHNLHINCSDNKKSACFWDTCEFDNPPIYIPKFFMNDTYHVYGCFCSPECAVAYLMEENIDSSVKFERYQLINHIYSKVYNYNKNIKPAPNPFYMLEKYYGNLTIQEYRSLLRNERLFLVVDKPLRRIMPELHEDNDDFIINNKIIPSNTYQIKKKIQKKQTKNNILNEHFGLAS